ncbi:choice-of-anchor Q domain-containing protein [Ferrimicrobium sp.]|uniref:beta strand repeat-containing protein n=1 Tax=Ferrimicrobium sp. TaxID=2926050 RepID=UPI00262B5865|nr:choice-of-anchor Q domain-containing protein [Ferrimicrobium sp.]
MTTSRSRGRKLFGYLGRIGGGLGLALGLMVGTVTVSQSAFATTTSTLYAAVTPQGTGNCSTTTDACSLSNAISQAASGDTIELVTPGTSGTYGAQIIPGSLTVTIEAAPGVLDPTFDGNGTSSITVDGSLTLIGVTISGNTVSASGTDAPLGGGIANGGTLTINDSTISGNSVSASGTGAVAEGGGIANVGTLTINDSTISGNTVSASGTAAIAAGGGIANIFTGTLTINDSTISGNSVSASGTGAIAGGGGIANISAGTLTINDSTISGNSVSGQGASAGEGGGIANVGTLTINDSTISGNSVSASGTAAVAEGGGILNAGTAYLAADLLATPGGAPSGGECAGGGTFTDEGYNVSDDSTCGFNTSSTSTSVSDSKDAEDLTSLGNYGGTTKTILPTLDNPAIGLIPADKSVMVDGQSVQLCPTTDQRGFEIPNGVRCDAGSTQVLTQTITGFEGPSPAVYGSSGTLGASGGGSGQPLVFSVASTSGTGVCNVSGTNGSTVTFTGVGNCIIDINQAGENYYLPAPEVSETLNVTPATPSTPTITNLPTGGIVGGGFTASVTTSGDGTTSVTAGPASVCSASGLVVSYVGAGQCQLIAHVSQGAGYTSLNGETQSINISQATQTINFSSTAPTNAQVRQTYALAATSSSGLVVSFAVSPSSVCSISSGVVSFTGAGTCIVTASQGGNSEYAPASTTQSVNVVAVPVTSTSATTPSSTTPSTPAPKTSSSTTSAPTTKPQSVTIKTGPPVAPSTTNPLVPIGLGLGASGFLGLFGLNRKRRRAS